jgi:hypothetical protein
MFGESMVCGRCRAKYETDINGGTGAHRFARALLFGGLAALAGAAVYYAILATTGYSIGIIAIFVGYLVGRAVHAGSRGKGGRKYQLLAAFLTYFAMSSTYLVEGLRQLSAEKDGVAASTAATPTDSSHRADASAATEGKVAARTTPGVGTVFVALAAIITLVLLSPILAGFSSPILLLILGFGVWQAWKMNRRIALEITGPFTLAPASPPPAQA